MLFSGSRIVIFSEDKAEAVVVDWVRGTVEKRPSAKTVWRIAHPIASRVPGGTLCMKSMHDRHRRCPGRLSPLLPAYSLLPPNTTSTDPGFLNWWA